MEVKIGKGLLSQTEKPFDSSNNKITLDGFEVSKRNGRAV